MRLVDALEEMRVALVRAAREDARMAIANRLVLLLAPHLKTKPKE